MHGRRHVRLCLAAPAASSDEVPAAKRPRRGTRSAAAAEAAAGGTLRTIHAHRLILAQASDFFRARLNFAAQQVRRRCGGAGCAQRLGRGLHAAQRIEPLEQDAALSLSITQPGPSFRIQAAGAAHSAV